ncbi:MAG: 2-C-methyl-D-erythritol 4-phosphate cytidylyltransferase [Gammaproteobacteria bacterium]|nr:2-C-methyl-D-erythritol 4-phosphate cytidylyltransferase [Gammaproteobacteria bacterium]
MPAAGSGSRMQADIPKQYLRIADKTILERSIECFIDHPGIKGIVLAISKDDAYWPDIADKFPNVITVEGGKERFQSVLNGLKELSEKANADDWVLVHDAARPCLRRSDIDKLMSTLSQHSVGGLLGLPMADTVKRCEGNGAVVKTVPRHDLWRALTPQMFRLEALISALEHALADKATVTDEASAMERMGLQPQMVAGHSDNIKVTHPEDLELACLYLSERR